MSDVVCRSLQYTNRLNYGVSHDLDDLALQANPNQLISNFEQFERIFCMVAPPWPSSLTKDC